MRTSSADCGKGKRPVTLRTVFEAVFVPLTVLVLWSLVSALGLVNAYLVPSPGRVLAAAAGLFSQGELGEHILVSTYRVWAGYGLSVLFALPAALLFHINPRLRGLFHGTLEFFRAVPPLAMIPLLILWFGIGEASKIAVIVLATFFPIFLNSLNGFDSLDGRWFELSRSLELPFTRHLSSVLIPGALPQIVTGLRLGFGYSWRALLGAELFSSASGLGYLITDSQEMARVDKVFVGIAAIGLLGLFFDRLLRVLTDRMSPSAGIRNWGTDG